MKLRDRIARALLRVTRRIWPQLDRVLANAGGTVERLAERVDFYREQASEEKQELADRAMGYRAELDEAIALSHDPWSGAPKVAESRFASPSTRELVKVRESIPLRETIYGMAELEIALDDRGWKRMIAYSTYEFSRYGIQSIILISRLYFLKNPLIRRGVQVSSIYIFGRGMDPSSSDDDANDILQKFFADPRNTTQLSHTAFVKHEETLWTDGNLFWAFFTDPTDGSVVMRNIDALEVSDIISDPNDASVPWYYHRQWTEMSIDARGARTQDSKDAWYVAMGWEDIPDFPKLTTVDGAPVMTDKQGVPIPVMHVKEGYLPKWRFGCPLVYPALDWARAYREFLENLCTVWKALSRIALTVETKGGAPAIAALKQTLATTFMQDLNQIELNPPPVSGSAFVSGPNTKITPLKQAGVTVGADESRRIMLMVCAAFGLGEHFFGNIEAGNLATATALDRPTELQFLARQEVWRETVQRIGHFVLKQSLRAPGGKLREAMAKRAGKTCEDFDPSSVLLEMQPITRAADDGMVRIAEAAKKKPKAKTSDVITISCTFPAIVEGDQAARVNAIVAALTLGGYPAIGIDEKIGIEMLLTELGYEDAHELVEEMYPKQAGDEGYERDRTIQPEPPEPPKPAAGVVAAPVNGAPAVPTQPPAEPAQPTAEPPAAKPAKAAKKSPLTAREASLLRALAGLRKVIQLQESKHVV